MNTTEFRAIQAPFKEKYRSDPASALGTMHANGKIHTDSLTCEILHDGPVPRLAGLHPMTGGDGKGRCPAEMLLESLVGCAGVTLAAVSTSMGISISEAFIRVAAELDFRGTLGVSPSVPVGFQSINIVFEIDSDESDDKIQKLVQLSEKYCVVAQSLNHVSASWKRISNA